MKQLSNMWQDITYQSKWHFSGNSEVLSKKIIIPVYASATTGDYNVDT
jgi:hypothetical protein